MRLVIPAILGTLCLAAPVHAQHEHQHSPYADQNPSGIAALSAEELEALETGAGMGLARAAELNHYPGPLHVLELADSLVLTRDQRSEVERIRAGMLARAIELGGQVIEAERSLNTRFEHGHIDDAAVREATAAIGALQGELRYTHLAAHLAVKALLTPAQVETYDRLRGYSVSETASPRPPAR